MPSPKITAVSGPVQAVDPDTSHDGSAGFSVGFEWVNATTGVVWICQSNDKDNAKWVRISQASIYTGQVATRCCVPSAFSATNKQLQSRSRHFARDDITSLQLVLPNFYVSTTTFVETGTGAAASVTASIEYPVGTFTQVKFGGAATGNIPDNSTVTSDGVAVNIPAGAEFFVRVWFSSTGGIPFLSGKDDNTHGEALTFGVTVSDQTMSGTVANQGNIYLPCAIIAPTKKASVFMAADSRGFGQGDTFSDATGDQGELARSIGPTLGYINGGVTGDRVQSFLASRTNRLALAKLCSHVVLEYGINDLTAGRTVAQIKSDYQTLIALIPGKPVFATTKPPKTNVGNTATTTDPTALNADIRAGLPGVTAVFDVAKAVSTDSRWISPAHTSDGVHESNFGYMEIVRLEAINAALISR